MTKKSRFALVGLAIGALLVVAVSALFGAAPQARLSANAFATTFALPELVSSAAPELRIWIVHGESGLVTGYVVRSGEVRIYDTRPTAGAGQPRPRVVQTGAANEMIRLLPRLRRVRVGRCEPVLDAGSVVVEGTDNQGRFAFEIDGDCDGWNLHVVDRVMGLAQAVAEPDFGED
jgi:hypothetical protein